VGNNKIKHNKAGLGVLPLIFAKQEKVNQSIAVLAFFLWRNKQMNFQKLYKLY
jgi:hypothetical protein